MSSTQHYRERAAHLRQLAALITDPALREQIETAAADYEQFADEIEGRRAGRSAAKPT